MILNAIFISSLILCGSISFAEQAMTAYPSGEFVGRVNLLNPDGSKSEDSSQLELRGAATGLAYHIVAGDGREGFAILRLKFNPDGTCAEVDPDQDPQKLAKGKCVDNTVSLQSKYFSSEDDVEEEDRFFQWDGATLHFSDMHTTIKGSVVTKSVVKGDLTLSHP